MSKSASSLAFTPSVAEALSDTTLPPQTRLAMWFLAGRLDVIEFREVKTTSLAHEMGIEDQTAGRALRTLVASGYLSMERKASRARAFRLVWSRRRDGPEKVDSN